MNSIETVFEPALDPMMWSAQVAGTPVTMLRPSSPSSVNVRRWTGTDPRIAQPRLTHHYLVLHMGGPKRIVRTGGSGRLVREAALHSLTLVPAGAIHEWVTEGPIDFAHIYIDPARLARMVGEVFDRDPARFSLEGKMAFEDALIVECYQALLAEAKAPHLLYLETIFETLLARLIAVHGNLAQVQARVPYALTPSRLRAVREFVETSFADPVTLDDLARIAGLSRFHFNRAFRRAEGVPPYAYVTRRRLREARRLLRETDRPVADIALACGYANGAQFASAFRRAVGLAPSDYRAAR